MTPQTLSFSNSTPTAPGLYLVIDERTHINYLPPLGIMVVAKLTFFRTMEFFVQDEEGSLSFFLPRTKLKWASIEIESELETNTRIQKCGPTIIF